MEGRKNARRVFNAAAALLAISGLLAAGCVPAYAGDPLTKLGRGLSNTATGWLEFFKEIGLQVDHSGHMAGLFVGPIKGAAKAAGRTMAGVYDTLTFLIPFPEDYGPLIEPEYVF